MYDPLVHSNPGMGKAHTSSYWVDTAGEAPDDDGPVVAPMEVDVAVIGAGYTGLSCALHLARDHQAQVLVLEANTTAWGCSGRNGSFARISGGRVPLAQLIARYGKDTARAYFGEMQAALGTVKGLIADGGIDCDTQPDGVYKVAIKAPHAEALKREADLYNDVLGYPAHFVSAAQLQRAHAGAESFGALRMPDGFAMHPLKLAWGVQRMARAAGVKVHVASPVTGWSSDAKGHLLTTPGGVVRARRVVVATNGYTSRELHPQLAGRVLPVHSQIIVTAPLSAEQVRDTLPSSDCMFDTRNLLFYYRRLPDNRLLFGGRSAVTGREAENPLHRQYLLDSLRRKFPVLSQVPADYGWGGWVAVSQNSLPYIYQVPELQNVFSAGGYAGSGVSFSLHAGKRLADMVMGRNQPSAASFLHEQPQRFPFQPFLRLGQRLAYSWYRFQDAR